MVIRDIFSNDHTWALELKETGHVIGCMGYYPYGESNIEIGEQDVEVGYWIGKPYWNKGLCTEALRVQHKRMQKHLGRFLHRQSRIGPRYGEMRIH